MLLAWYVDYGPTIFAPHFFGALRVPFLAHLCAVQPNMSATDGHDISDIHTSTTVGESLSDPGAHGIDGSEAGHSVGVEHHPNIPAVGASVSISDPSATVSINERSSTALLNLASSCSLTEILNVQQQALEQFQCQLQLAQQNEAINQRLDAIERTLNNLIHQKAQEEAVRSVGGQSVTPIRPSQQLDASISGSSNESKKKKLPRELCVSSYCGVCVCVCARARVCACVRVWCRFLFF